LYDELAQTVSILTDQDFWQVVQDAHDASAGDMTAKCEAIRARLIAKPGYDVLSFREHFDRSMDRAYDHALWGAAYVINGGCGDDTFNDFRACLISRGRQAYEDALSDPDSMADGLVEPESWFFEGYEYAISDAVRAVHRTVAPANSRGWLGRLIPSRSAGIVPIPPRYAPLPREPAGTRWSEDDLPRLYPKLWARFA
jgi:hypothetical protein